MTPAGYSGKSLADKLGVKPGARLAAVDPPANYDLLIGPLPAGAVNVDPADSATLIHAFVRCAADLVALAEAITGEAAQGCAIWISWPKKASTLFVDLTEDGVRRIMLPTGWVDVKVCAVDEIWSGLKFLRRRAGVTA